MNIHFWILVFQISPNNKRQSRTKVDSSRRQAWAFTRLGLFGVWRRLGDVDEVNCPRFCSILKVKSKIS